LPLVAMDSTLTVATAASAEGHAPAESGCCVKNQASMTMGTIIGRRR